MDLSKEHKEQRDWYKAQIRSLPPAYRRKAEQGYKDAWQQAYDAEPIDHRKAGQGRRAANIRLRKFVQKVHEHIKNLN